MTDKKITYCSAITECCKRAEGSEQKKELIRFFDDHLDQIEIREELGEIMLNWSSEDWVNEIRDGNSIIGDEILEQFNDFLFEDSNYLDYAEQILHRNQGWEGYYHLCGVYWYYGGTDRYPEIEDLDFESDGPTTNLEELKDYVGL